jgi:hypothetical protein
LVPDDPITIESAFTSRPARAICSARRHVAAPGAVFAIFAGWYYWFPNINRCDHTRMDAVFAAAISSIRGLPRIE